MTLWPSLACILACLPPQFGLDAKHCIFLITSQVWLARASPLATQQKTTRENILCFFFMNNDANIAIWFFFYLWRNADWRCGSHPLSEETKSRGWKYQSTKAWKPRALTAAQPYIPAGSSMWEKENPVWTVSWVSVIWLQHPQLVVSQLKEKRDIRRQMWKYGVHNDYIAIKKVTWA